MEKSILRFLQSLTMETPKPFGAFHLLCLALSAALVVLFCVKKGKIKERTVLLVYGIGSVVLELLKQYMWSFSLEDGKMVFDYPWYIFPFQFCSTPMYVAIIIAFLKEGKVKSALIDYLSFFTVVSAVMVMIMPDSCFTRDLVVNIHTMYLHCGSFVVSAFLLINRREEKEIRGFIHGFAVFAGMVFLALAMNLITYNAGILGDETFNMFYISPYYESSLPVYGRVQTQVAYPVFLLLYVLSVSIAACGVNGLTRIFAKKARIKN